MANEHNEAAFAAAIAEVCRRHGLGISGGIVFEMQHEDHENSYIVDEQAELMWGPQVQESAKTSQSLVQQESQRPSRRQCSRVDRSA